MANQPQSFGAFEAQLAASPALAEFRLLDILDFLRNHADDAIDTIGVDAAIKFAHDLYDRFVAPIDIPFVPDLLEPTVIDGPAKALIAAVIRRVHERIHRD